MYRLFVQSVLARILAHLWPLDKAGTREYRRKNRLLCIALNNHQYASRIASAKRGTRGIPKPKLYINLNSTPLSATTHIQCLNVVSCIRCLVLCYMNDVEWRFLVKMVSGIHPIVTFFTNFVVLTEEGIFRSCT